MYFVALCMVSMPIFGTRARSAANPRRRSVEEGGARWARLRWAACCSPFTKQSQQCVCVWVELEKHFVFRSLTAPGQFGFSLLGWRTFGHFAHVLTVHRKFGFWLLHIALVSYEPNTDEFLSAFHFWYCTLWQNILIHRPNRPRSENRLFEKSECHIISKFRYVVAIIVPI